MKRFFPPLFAPLVFLVLLGAFGLFFGPVAASAQEVIPPPPTAYVNDGAGVLRPDAVATLNGELRAFEEKTSNQIVVAIYPRMQSESSIEDYTVRVAEAWRVGQKKRDNGAVLFVFIENRSVFIQVGYGLEGALPDVLCKQIIENEIVPNFRRGRYTEGITSAVHAMMAATQGEYRGTGRTGAHGSHSSDGSWVVAVFFFVIWLLLFILSRINGGGRGYTGRGTTLYPHTFGGRGGGGGGGGGWGGFSGGGGSFGGGGAGGRW